MYPIKGFIIEDNGIGFNDANLKSFETSDSTYKLERGGKGVGRFLWLLAFDTIKIKSTYLEGSDLLYRRFDFTPDVGPTEMIEQGKANGDRKTIIELTGYRDLYRNNCPKKLETIALKIVEALYLIFHTEKSPKNNSKR